MGPDATVSSRSGNPAGCIGHSRTEAAEKISLAVSGSAGPEWKAWTSALQGHLYHSIEWAEICRSENRTPLFFRWFDSGRRCVGIALGVQSQSTGRWAGRLFKGLELESYPAVRGLDVGLTRSMIMDLLMFARQNRYSALSILSYGSPVVVPGLDHAGFGTAPRIEFTLDLTLADEERWKGLSEHHRRKIKKAGAQGLVFKVLRTPEAARDLRCLLIQSRERRERRGEQMPSLDDAWYEKLISSCHEKNLGAVFLLSHEEQPVSGAFVSMYGGHAYYVYGGSNETGFRMDAPALLFWNCFSRCRELGCTDFSMGGVPASARHPESPSHGLYRFKAGFGGRQDFCQSLTADNLRPFENAVRRTAKKGFALWNSLRR
jgi:hypothetical protein